MKINKNRCNALVWVQKPYLDSTGQKLCNLTLVSLIAGKLHDMASPPPKKGVILNLIYTDGRIIIG